MQQHHRGFTLIELAIVLVIVGLISGGIMMGSDLIRRAEVQSVGEDFLKYEAAINNFKDIYDALPGDFASATAQWGALGSCPNGGSTSSPATCNGNDDGTIHAAEFARVWQHLANADMIQGAYTGAAFYNLVPNVDAPASRAGNAVIGIGQCDDGFLNPYEHAKFFLTLVMANSGCGPETTPLTPAEAFMLDNKFDNGAPHTGKILGNHQSGGIVAGCVTSDDAATGEYNATNPEKVCALAYPVTIRDGS